MKRTTVMLPDELDTRLRVESRRRGQSVAEVVREALDRHLAPAPEGRLGFFAVGAGGPADVSERTEEFVREAVSRRRGATRDD